MNQIWKPQANIVFEKQSATIRNLFPVDLGTEILYFRTDPRDEWPKVVTCQVGDGPDVYFVKELENGENYNGLDYVEAARRGENILIEDNLGASIGKTLAHEMGHFFGIAGDYDDKPDQLMHKSNQPNAKRIIHSEVDLANPND